MELPSHFFRNEKAESERQSNLAEVMQTVRGSVSSSPNKGEILEVVENTVVITSLEKKKIPNILISCALATILIWLGEI